MRVSRAEGRTSPVPFYTIDFDRCSVRVFPSKAYLETCYPDGSKTTAEACHKDSDLKLAAELGYRGPRATWRMSRNHEILHTHLTECLGFRHSPVLWAVAHGTADQLTQALIGWEEAMVLQAQGMCREAHHPYNKAAVRVSAGGGADRP